MAAAVPITDDPPASWTSQSHPVELFEVSRPDELAEVTRTFYASLDKSRDGIIDIVRLQRIQNEPLWQEYGACPSTQGLVHTAVTNATI